MGKTIALDLDGVIADIDESISNILSSRGIDDYDYGHWLITEHHCELSNEIMGSSLFWKNMKPFEDSWHQINYWFSIGYDIHIVTARRTDASISVTQEWLDSWGLNTMKPIFCKMGQKHEIIKDLNPIFMIEDNPNEVATLLEQGIKTYLRKAWYNRKHWDSLPCIGNLLELKLND